MNDGVILTPEQVRARKRRNLVIGLALVAFVVLVFFVSIARMHANAVIGAGP
jgi:hypothetical protein